MTDLKAEVRKRTCNLCAAGVPLVTYPPDKTLRHAEDGDASDVAEECTANDSLADWVVEQVEAAYQRPTDAQYIERMRANLEDWIKAPVHACLTFSPWPWPDEKMYPTPADAQYIERVRAEAALEEAKWWRHLVTMHEESYFAVEGDKRIAQLSQQAQVKP